mgnify:CR=1 FL=1
MAIERLSKKAANLIVKNKINKRATCVIKVYANHCKYCHELQETYDQIATLYPHLHFFAFNIEDDPDFETKLGFNGVPTILLVKTGHRPKVIIMEEPKDPHETMWYRNADIKKFIEENK